MMNHTRVTYFTLTGYFDAGLLKYLYFALVLLLYVSIVCANVLLVLVICMNRSLHEPMYLFLCSLFVNELFGSTGMLPFLLVQLLSDLHRIPTSFCFLQIYVIFSYANIQFCNLTVMSYDRYLAICCPLRYSTRMTKRRALVLVALVWLFPLVEVAVMVSLSAPLVLCGNVLNKVYCDNYGVVKLACYDTTVNNMYGIIYSILIVGMVMCSTCYTYGRILKICYSGSREMRQKAARTCFPHVASLLNFCFGGVFEVFQSRFDMSGVPNLLRIILSLYWMLCQPLFNPLIHGMNLSKIQTICKSLILTKLQLLR